MSFVENRTVHECLEIIGRLSRECAELGGPLTAQLYNLVKEERWLDIIDFRIDYEWAFSANDFLYARQIQALFQKQDFIDLGIDKENVAFSKFLASEEKCRETNAAFEDLASLNWDVGGILYIAQRKIAKILGSVPSIDELDFSFGPGATTSTNSFEASPRVKLSKRLECSMNLIPIVHLVLENMPWLAKCHHKAESEETWTVDVTLAPGNLSFVPKNCREHRSIVVEPVLNGLIQKAIGSLMKKKLLAAGMNLRDQTRNQDLAREGSLRGNLATIDLSSASDTVSRGVVWSLLPYEWACLLDMCRTPVVKYKKQTYQLEKFSSMGNAYTFELESLLYYALALAVCEYHHVDSTKVSVYGDDIIVPVEVFSSMVKVLEACGFIVNLKKTFAQGPFRESCGADLLQGLDIRPYYLHNLISTRVLFCMHNYFVRHFEFDLANVVAMYIPEHEFNYGPDGYGDGHLIGEFVLRKNRTIKRSGHEGGVFDTYVATPVEFKKRLRGDYIFPVYSIYVKGDVHDWKTNFEPSTEAQMWQVRGAVEYAKISIYTLTDSIFGACPRNKYEWISYENGRMLEKLHLT